MMNLQMKNPASAPTLNGVKIENIDRIRTGEHTAMVAFNKGFEAYPFLFETGQHAARLWLTGKARMSLAAFRENRWRAFASGLRPFDRILGMGFGLLRAMLLLWAFTLVVWLTPMHQAAWWVQSQAAPWLDGSLRAIAPVLPAQVQQWLPPALRIKYQAPVSAHAAAAATATATATATANLAHFL